MTKVRQFSLILVVVFLIGFCFVPIVRASLFTPGSEDDPLVTKTWVDNYLDLKYSQIDKALSTLDKRVEALESSVKTLKNGPKPVIVLTIGSNKSLVGNKQKELDVPPCMIFGRTMVPIRFVGEAFGVNFNWDGQLKKVTYTSVRGRVELFADKNDASIGGRKVILDVPVIVKEGRILVPLRFVGESLEADVIWHSKTKSIEIK